ncbi:MAG: LPS export ABC transporter periplasmic protein LptC, partial [Saprospiraceae bacterium]|nr:LPS export ABC transporter periplasmic protein LptC [Saprospiraceae bacterium]
LNLYCKNILCVFITATILCACSNKVEEIDQLFEEDLQTNIERGKNIRIIYSDSAIVRVIVHAPVMERYIAYNDSKDVFPKGILLEFMNEDKIVYSWLKADNAVREEQTSKITAKGNVMFYNDKNEKLETPELIWDEKQRIVYTEKLIRITQAEKGDTTYGFGFVSNQDFTRFEIKKKVQGKINVSDFVQAIN